MKKYKTLILLLILCMVVCIFAGTSYAWFVKVKRTGAVYFKTGEVEYSIDSEGFDNNFVDKQYVVPGDDLIIDGKTVYFYNNSSITSSVRVKIQVIINGTSYLIGEDNTGLIYEMYSSSTNRWEYLNGYWYYKNIKTVEGAEVTDEIIPALTAGESQQQINLINSIVLDGNVYGNSISTKEIKVKLYFQAKQADYADWTSIGDITTTLGE